MSGNAELWILLSGSIMLLFGAFGLAGSRVLGKRLRIFKYMMIIGALGFLMIPVAFVVAAVKGNISIFLQSIADSPLGIFQSLGSSSSYTDACINGKCADYCCASLSNPSDKWKDCNKDCDSKPNTRGKMTGEGCRFAENMPLYCDGASNVDASQSSSVCNNLPELGPITCSCCISSTTRENYWDCSPRCSSHPSEAGFRTSTDKCTAATSKFYCDQSTTIIDDVSGGTTNTQTF